MEMTEVMDIDRNKIAALVAAYEEEAEATGWYAPEIAFGLAYEHVKAGQTILDVGIGTGLGSRLFREVGLRVHGMDIAQDMLDACRFKGITDIVRHDLTIVPYPFPTESMDHAVCVGVLDFFSDLFTIIAEIGRILKKNGIFVFAVGDRGDDENAAYSVGPGYTKTGKWVTMYRHSNPQIKRWLAEAGFVCLRWLPFTVYMDREKTRPHPAVVYLAKKRGEGE